MAADVVEDAAAQVSMPIRHDKIDRLATEWLPEDLYTSIQAYEHRNFVHLVEAVEALAAQLLDTSSPGSNQEAAMAADPLIQQIHMYEITATFVLHVSRVLPGS